MTHESISGSCLCGNVGYAITAPFKTFQYCHCSRCRKVTGSAFSPNIFVPPAQFKWLRGEEHVGHYDYPGAKYFTTSFCKICGSTLPWTVKTGVNVIVPAGTLDQMPPVEPMQNIFWASKADWYINPAALQYFDEFPQQ